MLNTLKTDNKLMDIDSAMTDIRQRRPALAAIAESFAALAKARADYAASMAGRYRLDPKADPQLQSQGFPLLDDGALPLLTEQFMAAEEFVLPAVLHAFPALAPDSARLLDTPLRRQELAEAYLALGFSPAAEKMESLSEISGVPVVNLRFILSEVLKAVLFHESSRLAERIDHMVWGHPICPVCGAGPDMAILKDKADPSEFLMSKAGQLWMHCHRCSTLWRFIRLKCPSCANSEQENLEILLAGDDDFERAHLCKDCKGYFTCINLVDRPGKINLDMAPLSLLHLDILAQERGFHPMTELPWNQLGA